MLMLSDFCFSKDLWSVGCGSTGCDVRNPEKKWCDKVPDIYFRSLGSTLNFPKKHKIIDKGIS